MKDEQKEGKTEGDKQVLKGGREGRKDRECQ